MRGVAWCRPCAAVALSLLATAAPAAAQEPDSAAAPTRSTLEGVYTAAQATRGEATFRESCALCHASGYFTATAFQRSWSGRPIYFLHQTIRTTMPESNPGSLNARQVSEVLAYILKLNGYPVGEEPLPHERDALRLIVLEPLEEPKR